MITQSDSIVSKGGEETFVCPQIFIVKIRIILFSCTSTIQSRTERRGNRLVARETERERESVCDLALPENEVGVCCKWSLGKGLP